MGAWIEITINPLALVEYNVAPLVGAWIEIKETFGIRKGLMSLPLWERGLKLRLTK